MYKIDWNKWHDILDESISAFDLDSGAWLAEKFKLHWNNDGDDPVSAQSLLAVIKEVCTDLIEKYETGWKFSADQHLKNNTYYDAGMLCEEVNMFIHIDNPEIALPKLIVKLRKDESDKFYFEILIESVGQMF